MYKQIPKKSSPHSVRDDEQPDSHLTMMVRKDSMIYNPCATCIPPAAGNASVMSFHTFTYMVHKGSTSTIPVIHGQGNK